jgi:predicted choloylglycine hydrolase
LNILNFRFFCSSFSQIVIDRRKRGVLEQLISKPVAKQIWASTLAGVERYTFSGTHYEIGVQQGQVFREQINKIWKEIPNYQVVKLMKPRLLPMSLFVRLAKRRAAGLLSHDVFECYPKQAQRLSGIAEGAGMDMSTVLFMQAMELMIGKARYRVEACTTIALDSDRTATEETIVGKNFDYLNDLEPYQLTCETKPKEGHATLGCKIVPLAGMLDGMNEHGLTVTYNLAYTLDEPECFAPLSMALQEMLETCRNTDEAAEFITQAKRGGHDAVLTLADPKGNIKTVEITSNHAVTRDMTDGWAINTNHFKSDEMQRYEIPRDAVYSGRAAPRELLGVRLHESSEQRLKRAQELLKDKDKVDESRITEILRDHGENDKPSNMTICRHTEYNSTLRSVIFYPNRKTIKVLYGKPCQNRYDEFRFS